MAIWNNERFDNTVIQQTASKSHNIYLLSLYEFNNNIYSQKGLTYGSSVNNKSTRFYPVYLWDLYDLTQKVGASVVNDGASPINGHYQLRENMPWKTIFAKSFGDDSGSNIYQPLKSFIPLSVDNVPQFGAQQYSCNFSFSPLINIKLDNIIQNVISTNANYGGLSQLINDQAGAELLMYFLAKIPLFPIMVASSINSHYSFGPVFLSQMGFNVGGDGSLGIVDIDCRFTGGKALVSPDVNLFAKKRPGIEPIVFNQMNDLNNNAISENATNFPTTSFDFDFHRYRSASLLDVIVHDEYVPNFADLIAKVAGDYTGLIYTTSIPKYKIIKVSMDILQSISLTHTVPYIKTGVNSYEKKADSFGPRFAQLDSRTVSGEIQYFGYTDRFYNNFNKGLTLYFGGPFYFPMKNVDWSNPTISIAPGGGYIHTYKFSARLPDQTGTGLMVEYPYNNNVLNKNVSEFSYDSYTFNAKDFIQDYIGSFAKQILSALGIRSIKL